MPTRASQLPLPALPSLFRGAGQCLETPPIQQKTPQARHAPAPTPTTSKPRLRLRRRLENSLQKPCLRHLTSDQMPQPRDARIHDAMHSITDARLIRQQCRYMAVCRHDNIKHKHHALSMRWLTFDERRRRERNAITHDHACLHSLH